MNRFTDPSRSALEQGRPAAASIAFMLITVVSGLTIRFAHLGLPASIVKFGGSALWAAMILLGMLDATSIMAPALECTDFRNPGNSRRVPQTVQSALARRLPEYAAWYSSARTNIQSLGYFCLLGCDCPGSRLRC